MCARHGMNRAGFFLRSAFVLIGVACEGSGAAISCVFPCYFPCFACYFRQILPFRVDFLTDFRFTRPLYGDLQRHWLWGAPLYIHWLTRTGNFVGGMPWSAEQNGQQPQPAAVVSR